MIESEQCSLHDPDVRSIITAFSVAYEEAEIEPLAVFAQLELPGDEAKSKSRKRSRKNQSKRNKDPGSKAPAPHPSNDMFPIAGMPTYTGGPEQACSTLSRLLDVMDRKLVEVGVKPPLEGTARSGLLEGSCSLEDNTLATTLGLYREAFTSNGIRPLPPFEYFRDPQGTPADLPAPKEKKPPLPNNPEGTP
ncbi:MAG TPA: hypothetical protein DFR83_22185 [Deltaproteobacteria bacterium]|nr:hypothetical protein [Deltaproteobacteria bacterium]